MLRDNQGMRDGARSDAQVHPKRVLRHSGEKVNIKMEARGNKLYKAIDGQVEGGRCGHGGEGDVLSQRVVGQSNHRCEYSIDEGSIV
jgi:hypothetical protein